MVHTLLAAPPVESHLACRRLHPPLHAGDIPAGAEALAASGEHQGTDCLVVRHMLQRRDELRAHVVAHGVAFVGTVQPQRGDAVCDLELDQSFGHFNVSVIRW